MGWGVGESGWVERLQSDWVLEWVWNMGMAGYGVGVARWSDWVLEWVVCGYEVVKWSGCG